MAEGATAASSRPAPEATSVSGSVRFEFKPFSVGTVVAVDRRFTLRAKVTAELQGVASEQEVVFESHERIEFQIREMRGDEVSALDVEYTFVKNSFRMSGMDDEEASEAGKRYRVTLPSGVPEVTRNSGPVDSAERDRVSFDLSTITLYTPLVKDHLPRSLATGWKKQLDRSELSAVFGSIPEIRVQRASASLPAAGTKTPSRVRFDCGLLVKLEREGVELSSDLAGSCWMRPSDTRPLSIELAGQVHSVGAPLGDASSITGTAELRLEHTYSP